MKLIINSNQLEIEFRRLIRQYDNFYWVTAWAGVKSNHYEELKKHENKIKKIIVGIHFFQTHPDFIERFIKCRNLQFIHQPQGTFHPKLYLFYNSDSDWEIIMGSSNFTKEAFKNNTEANTLITSKDNSSTEFLQEAFKLIESSWNVSKPFSFPSFLRYKRTWENHRSKIRSLSGLYFDEADIKMPSYDIPIINMTWKEFITKIKKEDAHELNRRLKVIEIAKELFRTVEHFKDLNPEQRTFIAGSPTKFADDWAYFGSMKGRGDFVHEIKENNINISNALDQIPLIGNITRTHYDNFIKHFAKVFPENYIGVGSRLLAMKRPDVFYCLTSKNQKKFCKEFNLVRSHINYNSYWYQVIEKIYDSEWWLNQPVLVSKQEIKIRDSRAAFLDALYYEE